MFLMKQTSLSRRSPALRGERGSGSLLGYSLLDIEYESITVAVEAA